MLAEYALRLNERLLGNTDTADVEVEFGDGVLKVHSAILMAASDAFRGILSNGLAAEALPKRLSWKEHSKDSGQFFFRLLYTGAAVDSEWSAMGDGGCDDIPDTVEITFQEEGIEYSESKAVAGVYQVIPDVIWNGMPVWRQEKGDKYLHFTQMQHKLWVVSSINKTSGVPVLTDLMKSGCVYLVANQFTEMEMPHQVAEWNLWDGGNFKRLTAPNIKVSCQQRAIPLRLLMDSLQLAKIYHVQDLVAPLHARVQRLLSRATFNIVCQAAIKSDIQLLRMRCLKFAEDHANGVRELYESHKLSPEVEAELAGMWPPPLLPEKRRRIL